MYDATRRLNEAGIPSARLDAELLLSYHLKKPREYLFAHPKSHLLEGRSFQEMERLVKRRMRREPLAYIVGEKEFYGRRYIVTPDVLVPRPESETIIDLLKQILADGRWKVKSGGVRIADIGTGSGCLAITAKLEWPEAEVIATDISKKALTVAQKNAELYRAKVNFFHGALLAPILSTTFHLLPTVIMANLPYVNKAWEVSPEISYEPQQALYAPDKGLSIIRKLIVQAPKKLLDNGLLILEADPRQHADIISFAKSHGFKLYQRKDFIIALRLGVLGTIR